MRSLQQRIEKIDDQLASGVASNTQDGQTTVMRSREDLLEERERLVNLQKAGSTNARSRKLLNRVRLF